MAERRFAESQFKINNGSISSKDMPDDVRDHSLDITGVGRAMKAIPPESWQQLTDTACGIVESIVAPLTASASGLGKLIQTKFDRLVEIEKILTAEAIAEAKRKAKNSGKQRTAPRPQILLQVIEQTAAEADSGIRDLWSNLLANEMTGESVHPEIGRVLSRISSEDAQILAAISESNPNIYSKLFVEAVKVAIKLAPFGMAVPFRADPVTFNHAHLQNLGLIEREDGKWQLSVFGQGFIRAVTDPSLVLTETAVANIRSRTGNGA